MQYRAALSIPAGTAESDPASLDVPVGWGKLKRYVVHFPAGHAGKTFVQVWYRGRQVLPTSLGEAFRGDDSVIDSPDDYEVFDSPFVLQLFGWSPDAAYDHTVFFQFYIESALVSLPVPIGNQGVAVPTFEV